MSEIKFFNDKKIGMPRRKKQCPMDGDTNKIDYKDIKTLRRFISENGAKIASSHSSGMSRVCQNKLKLAIKRARFLAMLPYL